MRWTVDEYAWTYRNDGKHYNLRHVARHAGARVMVYGGMEEFDGHLDLAGGTSIVLAESYCLGWELRGRRLLINLIDDRVDRHGTIYLCTRED